MQKAKLAIAAILFPFTFVIAMVCLAKAEGPEDTRMLITSLGTVLLYSIVAASLIISYLNRDLKERGLRWKY